jgi:hypothetical protein
MSVDPGSICVPLYYAQSPAVAETELEVAPPTQVEQPKTLGKRSHALGVIMVFL